MPHGKVLVLEDDPDLASTYEDILELFTDRKAVVALSLSAMKARREDVLACAIAILDINLGDGQPSGIDAHQWLLAEGFRGKTYFMTGHARHHPLVLQAVALGGAAVLHKPVEIEQFLAVVNEKEVPHAQSQS